MRATSSIVSSSGPQRRQMRLRDVIAERPEQLGDDDLGARRHSGIARRIELEEPDLPRGIAHREARHHAVVLGGDHRPRPGAGPVPVSGPFNSSSTVTVRRPADS